MTGTLFTIPQVLENAMNDTSLNESDNDRIDLGQTGDYEEGSSSSCKC